MGATTVWHPGRAVGADWPQWMGPAREGVWDERGIAETFPAEGPATVWSAAIGAGYAGPSVAGGRVFVLDRVIKPGAKDPNGIPGKERLSCIGESDGQLRWTREWDAFYTIDYPSGPRATPTVHDGLVYALGAEGRLGCYRVEDGEQVWARELKTDFRCKAPTWGFAGHPLVFGDALICLVGGEGSTCVAFDRRTGKEKWRALSSSQAGYCPPTLIEQAGKPVLILWHGEAINALDPATGKVHWTVPQVTRFGVSMAGPMARDGELMISAFWWGCRLFKLKEDHSAPEVVWETEKESDTRTTHLNSLMCTPIAVGEHFYGVCSYGQLRCLDWSTGQRKWETFAATTGNKEVRWGNAFLTRLGRGGNRFVLFNEHGELIMATLSPDGYKESSRARVIEPDNTLCGRPVVWTHPAYANGRAFIRNDSRIVCVDLRKPERPEAASGGSGGSGR